MTILIKGIISAAIIVTVSELAKRVSWIAAIIASLPLTSILALCWLYYDTQSRSQVSLLSSQILLALLPSVIFFIALPVLLKSDFRFEWAMILSCIIMSVSYIGYVVVLRVFGIQI